MSDLPYPPRSGLFAFDLIKLLHRSEAVTDIGLAGVVLVTYVAIGEHREDYLRPPRFWNQELKRAVDMTDDDAFVAMRRRCIKAGWLVYVKGPGPRAISHYWATIPASIESFIYRPDRDKTPDKTPGNAPDKTPGKNQSLPRSNRHKTPDKTPGKTPEHSLPSSLSLSLSNTPPPSPLGVSGVGSQTSAPHGGGGGGVRQRVNGINPAKVQTAIMSGSLLALAQAFGGSTANGLGDEWTREAHGRALGVILAVFWVAQHQRSPIRLPSGLRQGLAAWDAMPRADREEAAVKSCLAYGVPRDDAP